MKHSQQFDGTAPESGTTRMPFVSLVGYRGTGKTTVARLLAARIGWSTIDADEEIERRAGQSIAAIFAAGGEPAFRDWESAVVSDLCQRERTVIAWGGGAVLRDTNRRCIRQGWGVWLTADPATLLDRITADSASAGRRPNLTASGGLAEIEQLVRMREPLYRECADQIVVTTGKSPEQVTDEIVCFLQPRLRE